MMATRQVNAWLVLAGLLVGGGAVIAGFAAYSGLLAAKRDSLAAMAAERERLEQSKARLDAEIVAAKEQLDASRKEVVALKANLGFYRGQIRDAERDKQTSMALAQLRNDPRGGTKKGTYIEATYAGAGQDAIKAALKNDDGGMPNSPEDHPDTDALFRIISGLTDLRSLPLKGIKLDRRHLDVIRGSGSIGYLELSNAGLVDESITDLLAGRNLWGLNLTQNEITVIPPGEAGRLAILDFRDTRIGDDEARTIARRFPRIVHINLTRTKVTDAGIQSLGDLSNLSFLEFSGVNVGDLGMGSLSQLSKLKMLLINDTKVSDKGFGPAAGMDALETVQIRGTRIGDEGFGLLAGHPRLQLVHVEHTRISDDGLVKFCKRRRDLGLKSDKLTIAIDGEGRRADIAEAMREACPGITIKGLKD